MIDIFCGDGKCQICGKEMKVLANLFQICPNDCYAVWANASVNADYFTIFIFVYESISIDLSEKDESDIAKLQVVESINYWKENDRYLMKLLEE